MLDLGGVTSPLEGDRRLLVHQGDQRLSVRVARVGGAVVLRAEHLGAVRSDRLRHRRGRVGRGERGAELLEGGHLAGVADLGTMQPVDPPGDPPGAKEGERSDDSEQHQLAENASRAGRTDTRRVAGEDDLPAGVLDWRLGHHLVRFATEPGKPLRRHPRAMPSAVGSRGGSSSLTGPPL